MKQIFLITIGTLALITSSCGTAEATAPEPTKPNILFLYTDDQTFHSLNALGHEEIHTPNLDRLVASGTTFTHAYNMGGWHGAICMASRAMIISGRSLWKVNDFRHNWIAGDSTALTQSWPRLMEAAGYDTYMAGKWHVDVPADTLFQTTGRIRGGMPPDAWKHHEMVDTIPKHLAAGNTSVQEFMPVGYGRPLGPDDKSWSPIDTTFGGFWEGGQHWSEVLRDEALGFIETAKNNEDPFFMYVAFNAPHDPRQAPQEYLDLYPVDEIEVPENFQELYPDHLGIGNGPELRDEALAPYPRTRYSVQKNRQEYYALISHLDAQIGHILDALEASGQADNTYIMFTADHGLAVGQHGLIGKQSLYDHSIRVPFVITGPDIPANAKKDVNVYLQDIMATALDLSGQEKPDYVEFNSVLPLATGEQTEGNYPAVYGAYMNLQRMIRKDGYKLLVYPKLNKIKLFDLATDPQEMNDLAGHPQHRERAQTMFLDLQKLQAQYQDTLDITRVLAAY